MEYLVKFLMFRQIGHLKFFQSNSFLLEMYVYFPQSK